MSQRIIKAGDLLQGQKEAFFVHSIELPLVGLECTVCDNPELIVTRFAADKPGVFIGSLPTERITLSSLLSEVE